MRKPGVPGPRGTLLLGSWKELRAGIPAFLVRCAEEHGDVCTFRVAHQRYFLIRHPQLIEEVLVHRCDDFPKGWKLGQVGSTLGTSLITSEGELWRRQRRFVQPLFQPDAVGAHADVIVRCAERRLATWVDGQPLDLCREMMHISLDVVCQVLFGMESSLPAEIVFEHSRIWMDRFERTLRSPLLALLSHCGLLRGVHPPPALLRALEEVLEDHRRRPREAPDLVGRLLGARRAEGSPRDGRDLPHHLLTMLYAGHETVSSTLACSMDLLCRHPGARRRVQAELDRVLGDERPGRQHLDHLPATRRVIQETLRLYPPAWFLLRRSRVDSMLGGFLLPRNAALVISPYVTHRDARFFPDPERFLPERWSSPTRPRAGSYLPFGAGARSCLGRHLATAEATLVLAAVLQQWDFTGAPDASLHLQPSFTLRARSGTTVRALRRAAGALRGHSERMPLA